MAKIQLTAAELISQSREMSSLQKEYESLFKKSSSALNSVNANWSAALSKNFAGKITSAGKAFNNISDMLGNGAAIAVTSATLFENADKALAKNILGDSPSTQLKSTAASIVDVVTDRLSRVSFTASDAWKQVSQWGVIGSAIATVGGAITGGVNAKNAVSVLKQGADLTGKIAKAVPKTGESFNWKTLLGLNSVNMSDFTLSKQIAGFSFKNATTVSAKVGVAAKWVGNALTVVTEGIENFKENKNVGRAIFETAGESAVKIGEGMLVTAGVTAAAAAIGITAAPAVAVGAVTVGVVWGLDQVSKMITGKPVDELISDAVIDTGIAAWNGAKKVGSAVASGAKKAAKSAAKAVGTAAKTAKKAVSAIGKKWKSLFH